MFWTVMGCVTVAETTVEWLVNWCALIMLLCRGKMLIAHRLPFYYQAKTVAILWLTLPQIQVRNADFAEGQDSSVAYRARPLSMSPTCIRYCSRMRRTSMRHSSKLSLERARPVSNTFDGLTRR